MLIVMAIYMLINTAYSYVLPIDVMAKSKLVAADVAEKCFSGGGRWIAAAVMVSTFGTTNSIILATARVYFSMARRNVFPKFLGVAHPRFHTPAASLVVQGIWSVLLLFSGTFDTLTDMLIFISWAFYAVGAYGVFVLRRKMPDTPRPYTVPGYPFVPGSSSRLRRSILASRFTMMFWATAQRLRRELPQGWIQFSARCWRWWARRYISFIGKGCGLLHHFDL